MAEARIPVLLDGEMGIAFEADLVVTYDYSPARRAFRNECGQPTEPDEPESVWLVSAALMRGERVIDAEPAYDESAVRRAILTLIKIERDVAHFCTAD